MKNQADAIEIQRRYYTETAARYDSMHSQETSTNPFVLKFVTALARMIEARSLLDVGTATGSGLREITKMLPEVFACGVEPVIALIRQSPRDNGSSQPTILQASGDALPFPHSSFDVVSAFGVLHHTANPSAVIQEMLRVASRAVFICDSNRFGQGSTLARFLKLFLFKTGLWPAYIFLRTRGKGYLFTEGDGLAYSFSVFDSYQLISQWADRIVLIPTGNTNSGASWFHPLLTSGGVLLCAFKEPSPENEK